MDDSKIYVEVQRNEDNQNNFKEREGEGLALPDDFLQRLPAKPGQGRRRAVQSGQQAPARPTPGQVLAPEPDAAAARQGGSNVREKTLTPESAATQRGQLWGDRRPRSTSFEKIRSRQEPPSPRGLTIRTWEIPLHQVKMSSSKTATRKQKSKTGDSISNKHIWQKTCIQTTHNPSNKTAEDTPPGKEAPEPEFRDADQVPMAPGVWPCSP